MDKKALKELKTSDSITLVLTDTAGTSGKVGSTRRVSIQHKGPSVHIVDEDDEFKTIVVSYNPFLNGGSAWIDCNHLLIEEKNSNMPTECYPSDIKKWKECMDALRAFNRTIELLER